MSTKNIGWNFDNSYLQLPEIMATKYSPVPVKEPKVIIFNHTLAKTLGLDFSSLTEEEKAKLFSGNSIPNNTQTFAQSYAGHQFGHFTMLGDGRAIVLGEHISPEQKRFDIQFKGSGRTPFSRSGDGRAALGPMLREYIISEAMHAYNNEETLAGFKCPKKVVFTELPKTSTGKILKYELREMAKAADA